MLRNNFIKVDTLFSEKYDSLNLFTQRLNMFVVMVVISLRLSVMRFEIKFSYSYQRILSKMITKFVESFNLL